MRISVRTMNAFGYIGLTVLVILALLTWLGVIPQHLQLPVFLLAVVLLLVRLTLRLLAERTKRLDEQEQSRKETERRPGES